MVVAVRAVLVSLLKVTCVLAEALAALLARKSHLKLLLQRMRLLLGVASRTLEPLAAAGRADRHLGVEDVLAVRSEIMSETICLLCYSTCTSVITYHMIILGRGPWNNFSPGPLLLEERRCQRCGCRGNSAGCGVERQLEINPANKARNVPPIWSTVLSEWSAAAPAVRKKTKKGTFQG